MTTFNYTELCDLVLNNRSLRDRDALIKYLQENSIQYDNKYLEASLIWVQQFEPKFYECYQCEKMVPHLFMDSRCKDCTRISPDELTGGD